MAGWRNPALIWRDEGGATLVEFAFVLVPTLLLVLGGLELAYASYVRATMQGALNESARRASVQNPQFTQLGDTLEKQVEESIREIVGSVAKDSEITVTQRSFFDFSDIGNAEKLIRDVNGNGLYDPGDGDCFEDANDNGQFDLDQARDGRGGSNDVVFYTAQVSASRLFPLDRISGFSGSIDMTLEAAIRNQPFGDQTSPAVICGDGA